MQHSEEPTTLIQSVQRAAQILKAFNGDQADLGVNEIARRLGLHKSTVSRLLATLEYEGLVERAPGGEKYRLGMLLVMLAGRAQPRADVRAAALPVLQQLAERTQETTHLAVLQGMEAVNIEQIVGPHMISVANWLGRRTPLHCVANGKAMLAFQPPEIIDAVLHSPLEHFTIHTITEPLRLREEMNEIVARGYAEAFGEIEEGLHAVAAPVRDQFGNVMAAVSVSGPAYRLTEERIETLAALTVEAAATISMRLGFHSGGTQDENKLADRVRGPS